MILLQLLAVAAALAIIPLVLLYNETHVRPRQDADAWQISKTGIRRKNRHGDRPTGHLP